VRLIQKISSVARLVREGGVDQVHARLAGGMLVGIPASVLTGRPSVSTLYYAIPWKKYPLSQFVRVVTINLTGAVITDSAVRRCSSA